MGKVQSNVSAFFFQRFGGTSTEQRRRKTNTILGPTKALFSTPRAKANLNPTDSETKLISTNTASKKKYF